VPPGILWHEEAGGYDVLEYHLAVPKEFLEAGRIFFMPYNVYSNFPLNSEMLSLLMMSLRGDAIDAAFTCQIANVWLAVLFAAGAWWVGRQYSQKAGIVAGVLAATAPWLVYLSGIAYVETGMLALGMLAIGAMLRAVDSGRNAPGWAVAAGLLAGFACGYKYTAIPLIAIPIAVLPLVAGRHGSRRWQCVILFGLAALAAFSPWMIRNLVNTHNPVFPMGWSIFGAKPGTWDDELQSRWVKAHGAAGSGLKRSDSRVLAAFERTVGDLRIGLMLVLLAIAGAVKARDRRVAAFLLLLAVQLAVWATQTHLFARFAVVLLLPLVCLGGLAALPFRGRLGPWLLAVAVTAGAGWNLYHLVGLYYDHLGPGPGGRLQPYGHTNWFTHGEWPGCEYLKPLGEMKGVRLMLVGEARTFYLRQPHEYAVVFNHHPLAQAVRRIRAERGSLPAAGSGPASEPAPREGAEDPVADRKVVRWLAGRGITHVLVHWQEMARLRGTYGFEESLTPSLFNRLEGAGLMKMGDFMYEDGGLAYATLYEVPNE
jgi:hypothetical protein